MSPTPPRKDGVFRCLEMIWAALFPDHLPCRPGDLGSALRDEVGRALTFGSDGISSDDVVDGFLATLPALRKKLLRDAQAAVSRDPSAHGVDEVILCYPGFLALMTHRVAHELSQRGVPLIPRMMSEAAHTLTGCDIHPDAVIGEELFIDHATGVVIGQTAVVGDRVTIFQGVTLGSIAVQGKGASAKRHPTVEDDVVIYANATILGGDTVIGKGAVIGGSCWITYSVPPETKVILANPRSMVTQSQKKLDFVPNWDI